MAKGPLAPEQRRQNRRDKMLAKSREFQVGTYLRKFTAPAFQLMIRAEAGARLGAAPYVQRSSIEYRAPLLGNICCVTCGKLGPWTSGGTHAQNRGGFHTGHFLASRAASIVLEETNVGCQCSQCNGPGHGEQAKFEVWMRHVHGQDEIDRLRRLKATARQFTREELVDLRIGYMDRLKAAKEAMDA